MEWLLGMGSTRVAEPDATIEVLSASNQLSA
jgi:hypothetical protein